MTTVSSDTSGTVERGVGRNETALAGCLRSRSCQIAGVVLAFLLVAGLHHQGDGLWYQGDAPRHAANGLFYWDLLRTLPADPVEFAVRYYARYPVINPATYPPLFYIFEGLSFAVFGPSPHAAKLTVLLFAFVAGIYTMAWARRWIGPLAGWAGAFLAFIPAIVVWSNTVMLNVPATALGLGALYHFRRWLETSGTRQLVITVLFLMGVVLTYYQGISVLCVLVAWGLGRARNLRVDRRVWWIGAALLGALVPIVTSLLLAPVNASRHLPSLAFLTNGGSLPFYLKVLPRAIGNLALVAGLMGLAAGFLTERWRRECAYLLAWVIAVILAVSLLPARDQRYVLLVAPAFVMAAAIGVASVAHYFVRFNPAWHVAALAIGLGMATWSAAYTRVSQISGFREIALYLQEHAPKDAVLYEGHYDGVFGFYVRALDPNFERRMARADRTLYEYGPANTFDWIQKSNVASADEAVRLLRTRSGCRWVAIEVRKNRNSVLGRRLLQEAVARPDFELVRSFPIQGAGVQRVDLYRMVDDVDPVASLDLTFPSFSNKPFPNVVPISR